MTDDGDVPRMRNGPNTLCNMCGGISNHVSGLCGPHRVATGWQPGQPVTIGDRLYQEWLRNRDATPGKVSP
jgi:hypothetical protein